MMDDIARLPEEQRVALVLREIGGASYTEIAQIGEVSQPRARTLVFQARSSLRASRRAREIPCEEIRLLLAKSRGGELRRSVLRHHLRQCQGCRAFAVELRARRRGLKCLLPLMPIAAFRRTALGSFLTSGGGGGAALVGEGVAAKALATGAIVIGGGVAGIAGSNAPGTAPEAPRMALVATKAPLDHRRATAGGSTDRHQRSTGTAHTPERGIAERRTAAPKRPSGISQPASPPPTHENAGRVAAADTPTAPSGGGAKPDVGPADPKDPATKPEKDDPGASGEAPAAGGGAAGAPGMPPGQSGSALGQSGPPLGQSGPPLGQSGSAPGQSGSAPGQSGPPLGQSGPPPGQNGGPPPGQSGPPPGNGGSPGNNGGGGSPRNGGGSGDGPA